MFTRGSLTDTRRLEGSKMQRSPLILKPLIRPAKEPADLQHAGLCG
jgi:hypothetical protein